MNRTLLLILCDFLLLNLLALTRWEKVEPVASQALPVPELAANAAQKKDEKKDGNMVALLKAELEKESGQRAELERRLKFAESNFQSQDQAMTQLEKNKEKIESNLQTSQQSFDKLTKQYALISQAATKSRQQTDLLQVELVDRNKEIQTTIRELAMLEEEKKKAMIQASNMAVQVKVAEAEKRLIKEQLEKQLEETKNQLEKRMAETKKQLEKEMEEAVKAREIAIKTKEVEIAKQSQAIQALESQKKTVELQVNNLSAKVQTAEKEKSMLQNNVADLKGEVAVVRQEKQMLQTQTARLTAGVQQLAVKSTELTKEFRESQAINANQMFNEVLSNRVDVSVSAIAPGLFSSSERKKQFQSILARDSTGVYALFHITDTPFALSIPAFGMNTIQTSVKRNGRDLAFLPLHFLSTDPRLLAIPVSDRLAAINGIKVYDIATNPFQFPQAVLVGRGGQYYGEAEFKLDPRTPNYVKMKNRFFNRLFGEFSPSAGDLVLSKSGGLLGVMVNSDYCAVVKNFFSAPGTRLDETMRNADSKRVFEELKAQLNQLPSGLQ